MLNWKSLISDHRVGDAEGTLKPSYEQPDRTSFQVDYDRIIFSEPFRRLARKTQVHPLANDDQVRNRLTHSLEVAGVGRSYGTRLWRMLQSKSVDLGTTTEDDLRCILQSACLAHDIGNPPFGHAGEFAIRTWVKENPETVFGKPGEFEISEGVKSDWLNFEGNAQGFRLACRPDNARFGYLKLTASSLAAMVKYPWGSLSPNVLEVNENKRKFNFFSSDEDMFDTVFESLGLVKSGEYVRHPLSFLSEAADDLCYRIADLADAVEMNLLDENRVRMILLELCSSNNEQMSVGQLRANATGALIESFWQVFVNDYEAIMRGERTDDLKSGLPSQYRDALEKVARCYEDIFAHRFKITTELGAFHCLGRIITTLCDAVKRLCNLQRFVTSEGPRCEGDNALAYEKELDFRSKRCFELTFGGDYTKQHLHEPYQWWLHQVMDFVSGMTDNFAQQFAREIEGF